MAKTKGILRGLRGQVGGMVFKNSTGGTVISEYKGSVRNPNTPPQVAQRIIFSTVTQAAKYMAPIINHSFEGIGYGPKSMRKFRKLNMRRLRNLAAIDFANSASGPDCRVFMTTRNIQALIPNQYVISDGSLQMSGISVVNLSQGGDIDDNTHDMVLKWDEKEIPMNDFKVKLGDLISTLFGLKAIDEQLTLVTIVTAPGEFKYIYQNDLDFAAGAIPNSQMIAHRLCLAKTTNWGQEVTITFNQGSVTNIENIVSTIVSAFDYNKSDTNFLFTLGDFLKMHLHISGDGMSGTPLTISVNAEESLNEMFGTSRQDGACIIGAHMAAGFIRSKYNKGNWLRSKCILTTANSVSDLVDSRVNFGLGWNLAPLAWDETQVVSEDERYLNEGGESGTIGE